jgi:hypothetical protein
VPPEAPVAAEFPELELGDVAALAALARKAA